MNEEQDLKVRKDMADDYSNKLSLILAEIDRYKKIMVHNPHVVVNLGERLHALFIKLSSKMDEGEIKKQSEYKSALDKINIVVYKRNPYDPRDRTPALNSHVYIEYKDLLELREIHLNNVMERIGLTIQPQTSKRRVG